MLGDDVVRRAGTHACAGSVVAGRRAGVDGGAPGQIGLAGDRPRGGRMSFEEFFREAYPRLMARAVLLCGDRADAEDAVAQAFAEVARKWDTASRYDAPEAYLHVTMTRKVFRLFKRRRLEEMAALELPVSPFATPHEALEAKEVLAAVAGLPPMQRAVLVHCCLDGMKQAEVAKLLHIQRGTVAAHLFKAR